MFLFRKPKGLPAADEALPGRPTPLPTAERHAVTRRPLKGEPRDGLETVYFGMGCFWGAERMFWQAGPGVEVTAVGYQGGVTPNPTYEEVCSGMTGHTEIVKVVFDPKVVPFARLLKIFWESHDPTQGMRQGNDTGTQYRSALYTTTPGQLREAETSAQAYGEALTKRGFGPITTEVKDAPPFFYAEEYHQQYLVKVPNGYCGLAGTGVSCPVGVGVAAA